MLINLTTCVDELKNRLLLRLVFTLRPTVFDTPFTNPVLVVLEPDPSAVAERFVALEIVAEVAFLALFD